MTLRKLPGPDGSEVEVATCNGYGCPLSTALPIRSPWLLLMSQDGPDEGAVTEHFHDGACLGVTLAFRAVKLAQDATDDPQLAARLDRVATTLFDVQPGVEVIEVSGPDVSAVNYLVWSNKRGMWWKPAERGFTSDIEAAGAYTASQAAEIALRAAHNAAVGQGVVLVVDIRPQLAQLARVRQLAKDAGVQ